MKRKKLLRIISLAVLAIGTSVAVAAVSSSSGSASTPPQSTPHVRPLLRATGTRGETAAAARSQEAASGKVDRSLIAKFALLRHTRTRAHGTAANAWSETTVATAVGYLSILNKSYGADPSLAGETTVGPGTADVWMVPGSTGACLVDKEGPQGAGSTCNATSAVDAGDLWTLDTVPYGTGGALTQILLGVAPDGNASVTVSWTSGSSTVVPVTDNVYSVPIGANTGWTSVTMKNSSGEVEAAPGMSSLP